MTTPIEPPLGEPDHLPAPLGPIGTGRATAETFLVRAALVPLGLLTAVITSRLEPAGRGAWVLAVLSIGIVTTLLGNGGAAVSHRLGKGEDPATPLRQVLLLSVVLGVAGAAILVPLELAFAPAGYQAIAVAPLVLPASLVLQSILGSLLGLQRLRLWNAVQATMSLTTFVALYLLVIVLGRDLRGAVVAWMLGQAAAAAVAVAGTRKVWARREGPFSLRGAPSLLVLGVKMGTVNLVSLVNYRIELALLESFRGLTDVGIYSLAVSLSELVWIVSSSVSAAIVGRTTLSAEGEATRLVARAIAAVVSLAALGACAVGLFGWLLIPDVFGHRFADARGPLLVLLVGAVAFAPASVLAVYFSIREGATRYPLGISLLSASVTAVSALVLIPESGMMGAAAASTLGYAVSVLVGVAWFVRKTGVPASSLLPRPSVVGPMVMALVPRTRQ